MILVKYKDEIWHACCSKLYFSACAGGCSIKILRHMGKKFVRRDQLEYVGESK